MSDGITYTWRFSNFEVAPTENGLTDVVKTIHWRCIGVDENEFKSEAYGNLSLDAADPENFVEFDQITNEWVMNIINSKLDVLSLESWLTTQIDKVKNPPTVTKKPPLIS